MLRSHKIEKLVLSITLLIGVSGCGTGGGVEASEKITNPVEFPAFDTGGQLIPIESENVAFAGYDTSQKIMSVKFKNGYLYEYYSVPPDIWTSFLSAQPDPWSRVGYPMLVQGGYAYKRIQ